IGVWKKLNAKEKIWLGAFSVIVLFSISFLAGNFYNGQTKAVSAFGGAYVEAVSESPHNLNPLLSTNDSDRDLSRLIFSSLVKYNEKSELIPDLAASYEVSKDGKTYTIKLKDKIFWHDGEPFSANDVVFTVNAVQNSEYNSPLRTSWQGVKAEAVDDNTVVLTLKTPYSAFMENLALLGILPKHIWSKVVPQNFPLADFNFKPIGTGPYRFVKLQKDSLGRIISINLTANTNYFAPVPFIKNLVLKFYLSEEEAVSAFNRKEVDGLLLQTAQNKNQLRGLPSSSVFSLPSLRVYAIFFNTDDQLLGAQYIREAINYAVDRKEILNKLFSDEGKVAVGPIPPAALGSSPDIAGYSYDPQKTVEILEKNKWVKNEKGIYEKKIGKDKEKTPLKFTITTTKSMQLAAILIRDYLKAVGIEADLKIVTLNDLQQNYLKTKDYGSILIGESYTNFVDPYVFWHGAAIKDPGLNLSLYNNKKVNKILEDARKITDPVKRARKLEDFQKLVLADAPAVFLYSPNYIYAVKNTVKNIDLVNLVIPSNRFSKVNEWFVETERIWK
ncbi:MAG: ABC transporter substrate-binding protein, partial [Candidatus Azambacteria bacterium]|nr:ABC transporter substrate-binding protein [Candidatus Azambacteria bacterium]